LLEDEPDNTAPLDEIFTVNLDCDWFFHCQLPQLFLKSPGAGRGELETVAPAIGS